VLVAPIIQTGRELARYFEAETPGLAHRQALNQLLLFTNWSPPRQALVWMALDVAIYSALTAAWYFKWRGPAGVSRRLRPIEYDYRVSVLYDRAVDCDGDADGQIRPFPKPSPGTPRHPAYPSGHSTYSAAASEILSYFFPEFTAEFDNLANNIGTARLWAGVHWRSDHTAGDMLGRCVARLIIEQLRNSCVTAPPDPCDPVELCPPIPTKEDLDSCAEACCGKDYPKYPETYESPSKASAGEDKDKDKGEQSRGARGTGSRGGRRQGRGSKEVSSSAEREHARSPQQGAAPGVSSRDELEQARGPQQGAPAGRSATAERERARSPQQGAG
jgi:membrane-associated phospholipid phosphatase